MSAGFQEIQSRNMSRDQDRNRHASAPICFARRPYNNNNNRQTFRPGSYNITVSYRIINLSLTIALCYSQLSWVDDFDRCIIVIMIQLQLKRLLHLMRNEYLTHISMKHVVVT